MAFASFNFLQSKVVFIQSMVLILALSSCNAAQAPFQQKESADAAMPETQGDGSYDKLLGVVRDEIQNIQPESIKLNIEFCGFLVKKSDGQYSIVGPQKTSLSGCQKPTPNKSDQIVAFFRTNGAYDHSVQTEIPSSADFDGAFIEKIPVYIGTPGGRLWIIDYNTGEAKQICKPKECIMSDPRFKDSQRHKISTIMTRSQVVSIEADTRAEPEAQSYAPNDKMFEMIKDAIEKIQSESIKLNIEFCGYLVKKSNGQHSIVGPQKGSRFGCRTPLVYEPDQIIASFHTHGAYDPSVQTEIPSSTDFNAALIEKVPVYIGTPGGRFWLLDYKTGKAKQICKPKECLMSDPRFREPQNYSIPTIMTRSQAMTIEAKTRVRRF